MPALLRRLLVAVFLVGCCLSVGAAAAGAAGSGTLMERIKDADAVFTGTVTAVDASGTAVQPGTPGGGCCDMRLPSSMARRELVKTRSDHRIVPWRPSVNKGSVDRKPVRNEIRCCTVISETLGPTAAAL